ncbi:MAG: glycosyltransferase [Litorimonas sp.]
MTQPRMSIVLIAYDMAREIPRTVLSCLPPYQRHAQPGDIEVIVVDNGSSRPVPKDVRDSWPESVRYVEMEAPVPSPARALNHGLSLARGALVCPMIDGARLLSPGIFSAAIELGRISAFPVIATLGYHLGAKPQQFNPDHTAESEDALLASVNWPDTPDRLLEISCLGGSSGAGLLHLPSESNATILRREFLDRVGGFDERFEEPGGGLVNLDFFKRCVEHPLGELFLLTAEGSFHQVHGGASTTFEEASQARQTVTDRWRADYERIHGVPFERSRRQPRLYGILPDSLLDATVKAHAIRSGQD